MIMNCLDISEYISSTRSAYRKSMSSNPDKSVDAEKEVVYPVERHANDPRGYETLSIVLLNKTERRVTLLPNFTSIFYFKTKVSSIILCKVAI